MVHFQSKNQTIAPTNMKITQSLCITAILYQDTIVDALLYIN